MKLGIRAKIFVTSVALISATVVVAYVFFQRQLSHDMTERIRADLVVRLRLVAFEAGRSQASADDLERWDGLADLLGERAGARVSLIRADGVVLGDSNVPLQQLPNVESHAGRPEFRVALAGARGQSQRYSTTIGHDMLYVAESFEHDGKRFGVARVAFPLDQVDAALLALRRVLTAGLVLAFAVALVLSTLAAQVASRTARALTDAARRMADGDLEVRTGSAGHDELAELGRALDRLAAGLSGSLEAVRAERDRVTGILSGMREGVLLVDHDMRVALLNPALVAMFGIEGGGEGCAPIEVIRSAELTRLLEEAVATDAAVDGEIELRAPVPRNVLVRVAHVPGDRGGLLAVFVDVTQLRHLETVRKEFVANASHELRTPIAAIHSAAETLLSGALDDPVAGERFTQMIARNAARLTELVGDLLELSRIESHDFEVERQAVDIAGVVQQIAANLASRLERARIEFSTGVEADLVMADSRALEHVLTNLVDNAVKYCPAGSRVCVTVRRLGPRALVCVTDNGPGIPEPHRARIFERFYRIDAGRSRDLGGTGLGLSIVKHLVEAMGSSVSVRDAEQGGAEFFFELEVA